MTPWLLLVAMVAAINLSAFIALRGRWDRMLVPLGVAAVIGTMAGNAIADRTGLEVVRIGDFHLVAASVVAQLAMLATDLLGHLAPSGSAQPSDGSRRDR
jgi:hypothetical protein